MTDQPVFDFIAVDSKVIIMRHKGMNNQLVIYFMFVHSKVILW